MKSLFCNQIFSTCQTMIIVLALLFACTDAAGRSCSLTLIADYSFFKLHGTESESMMRSHISRVEEIFRRSVELSFPVEHVVIIQTPDDSSKLGSLNNIQDKNGDEILDRLQVAVSAGLILAIKAKPTCLVHMMIAMENESVTTVGNSFRPGACRTRGMNTGYTVTTNNDTNGRNDMLRLATIAHEIAHGLGAWHDKEGNCQATDSDTFLMHPSIQTSSKNVLELSDCSKNNILQHLKNLEAADGSCLNGAPLNGKADNVGVGIIESDHTTSVGSSKSNTFALVLIGIWICLIIFC